MARDHGGRGGRHGRDARRVVEGGVMEGSVTARVGNFRWVVCALLFTATTINYVDRQVIGILKPTLQTEIGFNEIDYGNIVFAFQLAYAIGLLLVGRLMDRMGTRKGFSLAVLVWSIAATPHPWARSVAGFLPLRVARGLV